MIFRYGGFRVRAPILSSAGYNAEQCLPHPTVVALTADALSTAVVTATGAGIAIRLDEPDADGLDIIGSAKNAHHAPPRSEAINHTRPLRVNPRRVKEFTGPRHLRRFWPTKWQSVHSGAGATIRKAPPLEASEKER